MTAESLKATAHVVAAMAIGADWSAAGNPGNVNEWTARFNTEIDAARGHVEQAQQALAELARHAEAHPDEAYERELRAAGYRGAKFLILDYSTRLAVMGEYLSALGREAGGAGARGRAAAGHGVLPEYYQNINHLLRALCKEVPRFLEFMEQVGETNVLLASVRPTAQPATAPTATGTPRGRRGRGSR